METQVTDSTTTLINSIFSNQTTLTIAIILIVIALIAIIYFINKIVNFFIKLSKKSKTNIKLPGGIELNWEDEGSKAGTGSNTSEPQPSPAIKAEHDAKNIVDNYKYTQVINTTKQCVQSTIDFISQKNLILENVKTKQVDQASEFIEIVMSDIKTKFKAIIVSNHKDDPKFFIGTDPDVYKLEHALPRDFHVSVSESLNDAFTENMSDKNDAQIDEQSYKLSKTAINSLRDQFTSYGLVETEELLKILSDTEQQLKDAISNALRHGKDISIKGQKEIEKECERHNAEINRILSTITNQETNEIFLETK